VIVSQLHLLWQKVHNEAVRRLVNFDEQLNREQVYNYSRVFTTLLFQRVVIEDYLRTILHSHIYDLYFYKNRNYFYTEVDQETFRIPLEFSMAMFRFGHTMILGSYGLKKDLTAKSVKIEELLETGRQIPPEMVIDWERFFEIDETKVQRAGTLDLLFTSVLGGPGFAAARSTRSFNEAHRSVEINIAPTQDDRSDSRFEKGAKGLIVKDLMASRVVPTGGMLIDLIEASVTSNEPLSNLYYDLEIPDGRTFRNIVNFDSSVLKGTKVIEDKTVEKMSIDNAPLWLFCLLESSVLPFKATFGNLQEDWRPKPKKDRLGPVTSMVISEVLSQAIRLAPDNIYQPMTVLSAKLGPLSYIYTNLISSPSGVTMADIFNFQKYSQSFQD